MIAFIFPLLLLLLPKGSLHILEAIEKFWFDGLTVRPIVRIKKQPIRNPVIWPV